MRIHVTDIHEFKRCRKRYSYKKQGLKKVKDTFSGNLWFGIGIHKCLAGLYQGFNPIDMWREYTANPGNLSEEDALAFSEAVVLGTNMLIGYSDFASTQDDFNVLGVEKELTCKVPGTRVTLVATIDLLVERMGKLVAYDHKTQKRFSTESELELDHQMSVYLWMIRELGLAREYGLGFGGYNMYNMLRKSYPSIPNINKNGTVSRQLIDTTPEIYIDTVIKAGENPTDYADMIEKLQKVKFFHRLPVYRSNVELDGVGERLVYDLREMTSSKTFTSFNERYDCTYECSYTDLCKCERVKGDTQTIIDEMYTYEEVRK